MILLWIFLIGAVLILGYSYSQRAVARQRHEAFLIRAEAAQDWINSIDKLPALDTPGITLQKAEVCHWVGPCTWHELRSRTTRVSYHGPTMSIPIAGRLRYRLGSLSPTFERISELQQIDRGVLYLTTKRLFFDGAAKNTSIPFKSIVKIALFDGGFEVEKQTGRSPHIKVGPEAEKVAGLAVRSHLEWAAQANAE